MDFRVRHKTEARAMPLAGWNVESRCIMMKRPHLETSTCPTCGADELMSVRLVVAESPMEFTSCQACEGRWWERDGEMLTLDSVLTMVGRH
jgi:DNA-directed RNA polymerase subunit M/transcription elongation factor TFIIS